MCLTGSYGEAPRNQGRPGLRRQRHSLVRSRHDPLARNRDGRMMGMGDSYPAIKESELSELLEETQHC